MASKFWAGDGSSSESESSEGENDIQIEDEVKVTTASAKAAAKQPVAASRWANVESSSDEEQRRVVRSAKDKRWQQLREIIRKMDNHMKISDFAGLTDDYEEFQRALHKAKALVDKEGVPKFYIRALANLEDYVLEKIKDRESFKKLTKLKATTLNTLRAKIKKGNEVHQEAVDLCREEPKKFDSTEEEDDDSDDSSSEEDESSSEEESSSDDEEDSSDESSSDGQSDDDKPPVSKKPKQVAVAAADGMGDTDEADDEDDDSYWGDSSDESSSESEGDAGEEKEFEDKHQMALHKWGLKTKSDDKAKSKTKDRTAKGQAAASAKKREKEKAQANVTPAGQTTSTEKAALFASNERVDAALLTKTVGQVMAQRGKKATDRTELIHTLQQLVDAAAEVGPQSIMEMLGHLISGYFDTNIGAFTCLSSAYWLEAFKHVDKVITILIRHPDATFHSATISGEAVSAAEAEKESAKSVGEDKTASMVGAFLDRLDDELTKALQFADVHSEDYKERLRQSIDLLSLLWRSHVHFLSRGFDKLAAGVALRILEHVYYKPDALCNRMWDMVRKRLSVEDQDSLQTTISLGSTHQLDYLINSVLNCSDSARARVRAVLHQTYNRAIHGKYYDAKDLLHSCNLQELASQSDVETQILYNRCLTQLGLCAFRFGLIVEAHSCLSEICAMNRHRELLAQGVSMMKNQEKTLAQEREEKRRQLPYHMHISLELIEGVHNLSAMLLEVPNMAAHPFDHHRHTISKHLRRMLDMHDRQMFVGPPENPRETIIAATRALQKGDASECCRHIFNLKIWEQMPETDKVKEIIRGKVKAEALRTYLFTFSSLYHSFSVSQLNAMFDLQPSVVRSIVSKMMVKGELLASWDESSECIVINRVEPTPLQVMALQLAERVVQSVDQNELLLNFKNPRFVMQAEQRGGRRFQDDSRWGDRGQRWQPRGDYRDIGRATGAARGPQPIQRGGRGGAGMGRGRPGQTSYQTGPRNDWGSTHRPTWQSGSQNIAARA